VVCCRDIGVGSDKEVMCLTTPTNKITTSN